MHFHLRHSEHPPHRNYFPFVCFCPCRKKCFLTNPLFFKLSLPTFAPTYLHAREYPSLGSESAHQKESRGPVLDANPNRNSPPANMKCARNNANLVLAFSLEANCFRRAKGLERIGCSMLARRLTFRLRL